MYSAIFFCLTVGQFVSILHGVRVLGVIPARAGSKRLPGKNKLRIAGKTLWQLALDQALEADLQPVVSSDDPEILGGEPLAMPRPAELAQDNTPIEAVISYILEKCPGYDGMVVLNPTHPLRHVEDIKLCCEALRDFPSCTGVRKDYGYTIDEGARLPTLNEQGRIPRLVVTGAIYAVRVPAFLERRKLMITGNVNRGTYHLERGPHRDIDTWEDYLSAKALYEAKERDPLEGVL